MYWHPYHYTAHFYADLHVTASVNIDLWLFTIHFSVDLDLNADLHIWGPQFSGYGTVSIHVLVTFSASVSFGENENTVPLLSWNDFLTNCLPASNKILTINIASGLIASQSTPEDKAKNISANYVVNPKEMVLVCGSAIPIKTINNGSVGNVPFGIQPMGKTQADITTSDFSIQISKGGSLLDVQSNFKITTISKNMPSALWNPNGNANALDINAESTVKNLIAGVFIAPIEPTKGNACDIELPAYDIAANFSSQFASTNFTYTTLNN